MKLSCVKEVLEKSVISAERFVGKNITLPILSNILLEVQDSILTLTATNLESAIQVSLSVKSSRPGKVSIPAKILSSFIQSVKEEKLDLEERQQNLYIHTETRDTRINGMSAEDFPLVPKVKKSHMFSIEAFFLKQALEKVASTASSSEFKPELTGVFFRVTPKTVRLVSTDSFRLSEKVINIDKSDGDSFSFILPQRLSLELARTLEDKDYVNISFGEGQVLFESNGLRIVSRLVEGNFPEYTAIIPKSFETTCFLKRNELVQAVRSAGVFASKIQEVTLSFRGKALEVSSTNQEIGENKISLPAHFTGKEIKVSFNFRYLLDGLSAIDEEELFMGLNNENAPTMIKNKSETSYTYVLMPIKTN